MQFQDSANDYQLIFEH